MLRQAQHDRKWESRHDRKVVWAWHSKDNAHCAIRKAFSLLEFAVVMTILSLLVAGALSVSTVNVNAEKIKITKERMADINRAIMLYVSANQSLPCPASLIKSKINDTDYGTSVTCSAGTTPAAGSGIYQSTTATELFYGMIPVKTLGLPNIMAEDAWGSKFTYIINYKATNATSLAAPTSGFGGNDMVNFITILEKNGANQTIATDAVMAIISHGANKYGSFGSSSSIQYGRSSVGDEWDNDAAISVSATSGVYFNGVGNNNTINTSTGGQVAFDNTLVTSSSNESFDDIILFGNRNSLVQHLNAVTFPCQSSSIGSPFFGTTITWPAANYDQIVAASTACPSGYFSGTSGYPKYPTRRCGAFGVWAEVVNPCNKSN